MKTNLVSVQAVLVLCCMMLFSCRNAGNGGEANNEEKVETTNRAEQVQTVRYEVEFSKDMYDFFDMELVYTNAQGENVTTALTDKFHELVTPEVKIDSAVMKVTAKPKENMPQIDDTKVYKYEMKCNMVVDTDKTKGESHSSNNSMSLRGDKWKSFVSEEQVMVSKVAKL